MRVSVRNRIFLSPDENTHRLRHSNTQRESVRSRARPGVLGVWTQKVVCSGTARRKTSVRSGGEIRNTIIECTKVETWSQKERFNKGNNTDNPKKARG
jgi:hypothetical protein